MNLIHKSLIKELLKKYNAKPEKYLGQHFILSKKALAKMIEAAEIKPSDLVIEIGPGLGTLTQELAKTGTKIVAIEKDSLMIRILKETLIDYKNMDIIEADARYTHLYLPDVGHRVKRGKAVDKHNKAVVWTYKIDKPVNKQIISDKDGNLYFVTSSGTVYGLDANGQERWIVELGVATDTYPILGDGAVFVGASSKLFKIGD